MAVILIEGMDNSGKTTLVSKLASITGYTVVHSSGPDKDQVKSWLNWIFLRAEGGEDIIMDRCSLISEQVYGPELRGGSVFQDTEWLGLWGRLMELNPKIVYCRPSRETICGTINNREQMEGVADHCLRLVEGYDSFFSYLTESDLAKFWVYDYTKPNEEKALMDWLLN